MGNFSKQTKTTLQQAIHSLVGEPVSFCNVPALKAKLLQQYSWIGSVKAQGMPLTHLVIKVYPRTPVALLQSEDEISPDQMKMIDHSGCIFELPGNRVVSHLPILKGSLAQSEQLLQWYRALNALLVPQALEISVLQVESDQGCRIELSNGIQVRLGYQEPSNQLKQMLTVYPLVLHQPNKVASVDLRYPSGMAVSLCEPRHAEKT